MLPAWIACYVLVLLPAWPNPIGPASDRAARRYRAVVIIAAAYVIFTLIVLHTGRRET